jgi:hypothetical protein
MNRRGRRAEAARHRVNVRIAKAAIAPLEREPESDETRARMAKAAVAALEKHGRR